MDTLPLIPNAQHLTFDIQGSAPTPYRVEFIRNGVNMSASCTCAAGEMGQYCKHRINLLAGDISCIVSGNASEVLTLRVMLAGSQLETALINLHKAEQALDAAKREVGQRKKAVARCMLS